MKTSDNRFDFRSLAGKAFVRGEYAILDGNGKELYSVHNYLTYAGAGKFANIIAGLLTPAQWQVGLLSGSANRGDTMAEHAWVEPTEGQGYARQTCTVSEVISTTVSNQPGTVVVFTPVTFSCSGSSDAWDRAYTNCFLILKDNEGSSELISIGSQLASPVRLLPGNSFQTAYRLFFLT